VAQNRVQPTPVGSPLTPRVLEELGALEGFPPAGDGFLPEGEWVNAYRMWTCHGYRERGNNDVGYLKLARSSGETDEGSKLDVEQMIVHAGGVSNTLRATVQCRADDLASPTSWEMASRFADSEGQARAALETKETVRIGDGAMEVRTAGNTYRRPAPPRLTSDWCLFEAMQRRPFEEGPSSAFDVLEGLSLLREGHRLTYRGKYPMQAAGREITLHGFHQIGHGTLPYEYWLDEDHRLVMAVTLSRVYILDDEAVAKASALSGAARRKFAVKRRRLEQGGGS